MRLGGGCRQDDPTEKSLLISPASGLKKRGVKIRAAFLPLMAALCTALTGCAFASHGRKEPSTGQPHPSPSPSPSGIQSLVRNLPFLHRPEPLAPKAVILQETGTVRRVPENGGYAIIELSPGVLVSPGEIVLSPSASHSMSRLRVTEVQPPYFAAEILEGEVLPGDLVKH
jgi:hypothetical protein